MEILKKILSFVLTCFKWYCIASVSCLALIFLVMGCVQCPAITPFVVGGGVGLGIYLIISYHNKSVVDGLCYKLGKLTLGTTLNDAISMVGVPNKVQKIDDKTTLVTWDVHNSRKTLYDQTLKFVDGKYASPIGSTISL